MSTLDAHRRVARIARRQHGAFTRGQARWCGLSDRQIDQRVAAGHWVRLRAGVLAVAGMPATWVQGAMGATLACGVDAVAAEATGARLWEIEPRPASDVFHVLTPSPARRARRPGIKGHRSSIIVPADVRRHLHVPVTSPARTLVDCAAAMSTDEVGRALDGALRRRLLRLDDLRATAARLATPGRPGMGTVAPVLAARLDGYDPGDSDLEVAALAAIRRARIPVLVQQHPVVVPGGTLHLDLADPALMIGVELDGWTWHRHRSSFDRDRRRLSWLTAAGWAMLVHTSASVATDLVPQLIELRERRMEAQLSA